MKYLFNYVVLSLLLLGLLLIIGCNRTEEPTALERTRTDVDQPSLQKSGSTIDPGIVNWWPGDGNANDIISSNNGTLLNGATFASGQVGQAFSFDGVNDFVQIAQNTFDGLTDLTVDAWVKFDVLREPPSSDPELRQTIISALQSGVRHYWTLMKSDATGELELVFSTPDQHRGCIVAQAFPFQLGRFYHIAATKSAGLIKLFVDGTEIKSESTPCIGAIRANTGTTLIGAQDPITASGVSRPIDGLIDEVEIYNRALTASEIQAIFKAGRARNKPKKMVTICHKPGTPAQKTLVVPYQALAGHLKHGDTVGACE